MRNTFSLNSHVKEWIDFFQESETPFFPFRLPDIPPKIFSAPAKVKKSLPSVASSNPEQKSNLPILNETLDAPIVTEDHELRLIIEKEHPSLHFYPLYAPIVIAYPPLLEAEKVMLKKLSIAITNSIVTSQLLPFSNDLLSQKRIQLLIAPKTLLEMAQPKIDFRTHEVISGSPNILPLNKLDFYLYDIEMKRSLWQILNNPKLLALLKLS